MGIPNGNFYLSYRDHLGRKYYLTSELRFVDSLDQASLFYFLKSDNSEIVNNDIISIHSGSLTLVVDESGTPKLVDRNLTKLYKHISFLINTTQENYDVINVGDSFLLIYDFQQQMCLRFYHDIINEPVLISDSYHNAMVIGVNFFKLEITSVNTNLLLLPEVNQVTNPQEIDYKIILSLILILVLLIVIFALSLRHF